jgi:hypothetical protein
MVSKAPSQRNEDDRSQQPRQHKTPSPKEEKDVAAEDHVEEREKVSKKSSKPR